MEKQTFLKCFTTKNTNEDDLLKKMHLTFLKKPFTSYKKI
jgi:hypothetical protein